MTDKRICAVDLDERTVIRRNAEIDHERAIAIYDLLESNVFMPVRGGDGPYRLRLSIAETRLHLTMTSESDGLETSLVVPMSPFRRVVRDYFLICESYYTAIKNASLMQIEAIDMGRRGLHNEGASMLQEALAESVEIDHDTARRLFTLICVLHIRG